MATASWLVTMDLPTPPLPDTTPNTLPTRQPSRRGLIWKGLSLRSLQFSLQLLPYGLAAGLCYCTASLLTFVALGTSLPELVTAVTALMKGHGALSLGNIIGANIFNLVLVSGVSVTLSPFAVPASKLVAGMNASLVVDIPLMLFVMAFMTLPALIRGKLSRAQGIILLCIYAAYCVFQFAG